MAQEERSEEKEGIKEVAPAIIVPQEVEVEKLNVMDGGASNAQDKATRVMLAEVDESAVEGAPSLVDMWDRVVGFHDTNELVRVNIQQVQHLFQEAYEEHHRQKILDNERLKCLLENAKADSSQADTYTAELYRVNQERKSERKQLQQMAITVTGLAKEYRSCSMQRAMFIHIALIQQFTLLISASIQRNVKDPYALRAIGEDIKQAKRVCFPAQDNS